MTAGLCTPWACSSSECNGPQGLCIDLPHGSGNTTGQSGAGGEPEAGGPGKPRGTSAGEGGSRPQSNAGGEAGAPRGVGRGGSTSGNAGESADGGQFSLARGGTGGTGDSTGSAGAPDATGATGGTGGTSGGGTGGSVAGAGRASQSLCDVVGHVFSGCATNGGAAGEGGASAGVGGDAGDNWCAVDDTSSQGLAGAGAIGAGQAGGPGGARELVPIDDLEDGDTVFGPLLGGRGGWFMNYKGSNLLFPDPSCVTSSPAAGTGAHSSGYAMHAYGNGSFEYAQLGVGLRSGVPGCHQPVDATGMTGIRFWAKGTSVAQYLAFQVGTTDNTGPEYDGTCLDQCYRYYNVTVELDDAWHEYVIPFSTLHGYPMPFRPEAILSLFWQATSTGVPIADYAPQATCFDFWIDDVAFYKE